jgi:histidinol phosphatase-like enzyme
MRSAGDMVERNSRAAVFLDGDGIINVDHGTSIESIS